MSPRTALSRLAALLGFSIQEFQRFALLFALSGFRFTRRFFLRENRLSIPSIAALSWIASLWLPSYGFVVCFASALAISALLILALIFLEPSLGRAQVALLSLIASRPQRLEILALRLASRSPLRRSSRSRL